MLYWSTFYTHLEKDKFAGETALTEISAFDGTVVKGDAEVVTGFPQFRN